MPAGRPPEYTNEYTENAKKYLAECVDEIEEYHKTRGEKSDTYERIIKVRLPTIEGLAVYLNINKTTVYEWEKTYPEFSNVIDTLRGKQADALITNGLSGDYNPIIAKVLLTKHGYKDQVGISGEGEGEGIKVEANVNSTIDKIYGKSPGA